MSLATEFPQSFHRNAESTASTAQPLRGAAAALKATSDIAIAALAFLVAGPAMALIALLIKLDSRGPVFFKQPRVGLDNQFITVWKFRTMYADQGDMHCAQQTTKDDPRVTRVGRILRKTSLDELPQLINVLTGSMSLVGPRPHAASTKAEGKLFHEVVPNYEARHAVKPGITGWAQVNGWRGETDTVEKIRQRVAHDLDYIENWSFWLDLKIMIRTVTVIVDGENAY